MTDSICLRCMHKSYCHTGVTQPSENSYVTGCSRFEPKPPQTNADKIRAMTDEELAAWLVELVDCGEGCPVFRHLCNYTSECCEVDLLQWLQKEAE